MFRLLVLVLCVVTAAAVVAAPGARVVAGARVTLIVPSPCPGPVAFGLAEIQRAAAIHGWKTVTAESLACAPRPAIALALWPVASLDRLRFAPPPRPESYRIAYMGKGRVVVTASDPTGLMYGALELCEQLRWGGVDRSLSAIHPCRHAPYLELRGVNQFLHKQALDDPNSWYYSDAFWKEYLDALARSRHNFLDLHAMYDMVTTGFPNVFPYLIHLEEYPEADVGAQQTAKNLDVLRRAIALAADRGIKVGLMNYNAAANVPAGKLADYTAKCVEKLLRELPDLWAFGFRIGESGQPEDFFKHAYLAGIQRAGRPIHLYTRSWIASREKIMEIAAAHSGRFLVEIKYNGEQLGLPYQVQGERMATWGSYSYQGYTNRPNNYAIVWQIRAGGTHRIFQWGDPQFARRTVRSCRLGRGAGFSMEPISAYYPMQQYYLNPRTFPEPFFKWDFQRNWLWYDVWGRTAYDPDVTDATFERLFCDHYGPRAGALLFRATVAASKIIPSIYAYHCLGPDHRNMAPEFETGNGHSGTRKPDGTAELTHYGLGGFLSVEPLDDTVMDSPRRYVDRRLKGEPTLPFDPYTAARCLHKAADAALHALTQAGTASTGAHQDLALDIRALAALARYYAHKITAVTDLEIFNRTGDLFYLTIAQAELQKAHARWQELADITETHFLPVMERLRMYTTTFTWREEGKDLPKELEELEALRQKALQSAPPAGAPPKLAHVPPPRTPPAREHVVTITLLSQDPHAEAVLHYRTASGCRRLAMRAPADLQYLRRAAIPADALMPGKLEYWISARSGNAQATLPTAGRAAPFCVLVTADETPPSIALDPPLISGDRATVRIGALVSDASGIAAVTLHYRPIPSFYSWQSVPMEESKPGAYAATVPLTPEGLLYRVTAVDSVGLAAQYPQVEKETPYRTIEPWRPAWIEHDSVALQEGAPVYQPSVGQRVFSDQPDTIAAIPQELTTLTGLRYPQALLARAQGQAYGGWPISFKVLRPTRLFAAFPGSPPEGYGRYARKALTVGDKQYDIFGRDLNPGYHTLLFGRGPIPILLGFKELTPEDKALEGPAFRLGDQRLWELNQRDFVGTSPDFEFYQPQIGARVYTDRQYAIIRIPPELSNCLGLRFSNDLAKSGSLRIPFRLERPATLYVVFGNPTEGAWQKPPPDWRLFAQDAYVHGPGDEVPRSIYCKDYPAGEGLFAPNQGTCVVLGFR